MSGTASALGTLAVIHEAYRKIDRMNWIKYFFFKSTLTRRILDIEDDAITIIRPLCHERLFIYRIGGADVYKDFVDFSAVVKTDKMANELKSNQKLNSELNFLLEKHNYPLLYREKVTIGFVSMETVNRESDGNLWVHLV